MDSHDDGQANGRGPDKPPTEPATGSEGEPAQDPEPASAVEPASVVSQPPEEGGAKEPEKALTPARKSEVPLPMLKPGQEFLVERPVVPVRAAGRAMSGEAYASTGEWLAARRRALGLTLEEVEEAIRIREDYLIAIEAMNPRDMPAGPYAPGFVRTYAIHLDLDPEAVAKRFREEMSPRRLRTSSSPAPSRERPLTPLPVIFSLPVWGVPLALAAAIALYVIGARPHRDPEEMMAPPVPESLKEWVKADVQSRRTSAAPLVVVGPNLGLKARVPVWLEAKAPDGEVLVSRTLEAGETWTAPRILGIVVSSDNGGAVDVLLDGQMQKRMGAPGLPVTNWRADAARGLAPLKPPTALAAADVPAAPAAAPARAGATDSGQPQDDLAADEGLVTPVLPSQPDATTEAVKPVAAGVPAAESGDAGADAPTDD
jgi:hypothetical protein